MGISVILGYKNLINNIPKMIDISGYRNDYIAKKLGMSPQSFSIKKQRGSWTPTEVEHLLAIIDNKDVEDYCLGCINEGMEDEPTMTYKEFKAQHCLGCVMKSIRDEAAMAREGFEEQIE